MPTVAVPVVPPAIEERPAPLVTPEPVKPYPLLPDYRPTWPEGLSDRTRWMLISAAAIAGLALFMGLIEFISPP